MVGAGGGGGDEFDGSMLEEGGADEGFGADDEGVGVEEVFAADFAVGEDEDIAEAGEGLGAE